MDTQYETTSQKMSPGLKFFLIRIFPLIFIISGGIVGYFGIKGFINAKNSVNWPTAKGIIQTSSVIRQEDNGDDRNKVMYHAEVLYNFDVNGTAFSGNRISYGDYDSNRPTHARKIVNKYRKGKSVTIYYSPKNPYDCLLEPGIKGQSLFMPIFGIIFLSVGIFLAILLPRTMKSDNTEIYYME